MKYLLLIYSNPEQWEHPVFRHHPDFRTLPPDEQANLTAQWEELRREIVESGELIQGVALAEPRRARTVRSRDGVRLVTDGPYAEAKEHLAGYLVVECADPRRASEIASRIPDARFAAVEVRPIGTFSVG
ncbi:YciI family protein [Cryptosporangium aurantiacum]|uniref:Uncharacterized conserved protein n=1 Tax=Cryptosporangium aurantiacum TaxID=134849 RepID=A0A1M7QQW2_9ACTN|nr:YciI family protein [Cryptosporangium aurantiacum]SHN33915.1 Uncharacterized conserved protein [Cryptosporangium aurantiacum]